MRMLKKPEKVRREPHQNALRQNRCLSTSLRTTLSGVGVLSVQLEKRRVGDTSDKMRDDDGGVPTITAS